MLVSLKSVGYSVRDDETLKTLLHDVNFEILPKSVTTIIGPNGAGKTTLVRLLLGLIQPSAGMITKKKNITMGYVPQKLHANRYMPMTVENFLSLAGVQKIEHPFDVTKLMSRSIHALSGGELQKVLFNAAVLKNPNLLILDEPTQGIDANGLSGFYEKLIGLKNTHNMAVVLISHDLHFVFEHTDHVICLNHHICCQGTPEKVRQVQEIHELFPGFAPYQHHHDHEHS